MRSLLASTGLASLAVALIVDPASAAALTISDKQTAPVKSSTAVSGGPGDIMIAGTGSLVPTAGTALTLDSANAVANAGTIQITDADNATGILATAAGGSIANSGTITIDETYTPTDADKDGDLDGPFAKGSNRYGIRVTGPFTGPVANSGTIKIEGNGSAALALDNRLTGSLSQTGTISVIGDDSVGVRAGAVSGDVRIAGSVTVQGARAQAVALTGDIGGALTLQGTISATGYRSTTLPADTSKLDADDLLQGGPAVAISGSVAGGVIFAIPPADTDPNSTDDDKDGIPDASEGSAAITSYGAAPAVQIGAADHGVTIGSVTTDAGRNGIVVDGAITGTGVYAGIAGNGLVIGGLGGSVAVANGLAVHGSITATANGASATAVRIGSGAIVPAITNSGTIGASGGAGAAAQNSAVLIDAGANVASITNSGTISATSSGKDATSTAILDRSGRVTSVSNTGLIGAAGAGDGRNVAIDLSASAQGATVRQSAPASGAKAPAIIGDIRFGAGNDTLDLAAGSLTGNVAFGGGADNFTLSNGAVFTGSISGGAGVALVVSGGHFNAIGAGTTALGSLSVSSGGTLGVNIDQTTGSATLYQIGGAATFAAGSQVALHLTDVGRSVGTYTVVQAGSLTGGENLSLNSAAIPYMYKGHVIANDAAGTVQVAIDRKSTVELGLNGSETRAWNAVYAALGRDKGIGDSFLALGDASGFQHSLRTMLPDHAGGAFDSVTSASRATGRMLADPDAPVAQSGKIGFWLQQVAWGRTKSIGDTGGYHIAGWGATGGAEYGFGSFGRLGGSFAYLAGKDDDKGTANGVNSDQYEFALTWRGDWGGLHAFARGSAALIDFNSDRRFQGLDGSDAVTRSAQGKWNGRLYSGAGGASYRLSLGAISIRPQASIDYYMLREGHYAEAGDQQGFALTVASRSSDEFAASGAVALGYSVFDDLDQDGGYLRFELEGGRRQIVSGALGSTTAHFAGGQDFTLIAEDRTNGWTGAVRAKGGAEGFTLSGEANAEQQAGHVALSLRAGLQVAF